MNETDPWPPVDILSVINKTAMQQPVGGRPHAVESASDEALIMEMLSRGYVVMKTDTIAEKLR